ncbi:MAG: hypothetical protein JO062_04080 [Bryobacterales bacterium]|nr:hypothetical protein [Bryobacterales bacterium]
MNASRRRSAKRKELTPAEQGKKEKNLAYLLIVAHDQGVPAAIEELRRMRKEKREKGRNSPGSSMTPRKSV